MEAGGVKKRYAKEHGSILKADSKTFFIPLGMGRKGVLYENFKEIRSSGNGRSYDGWWSDDLYGSRNELFLCL